MGYMCFYYNYICGFFLRSAKAATVPASLWCYLYHIRDCKRLKIYVGSARNILHCMDLIKIVMNGWQTAQRLEENPVFTASRVANFATLLAWFYDYLILWLTMVTCIRKQKKSHIAIIAWNILHTDIDTILKYSGRAL